MMRRRAREVLRRFFSGRSATSEEVQLWFDLVYLARFGIGEPLGRGWGSGEENHAWAYAEQLVEEVVFHDDPERLVLEPGTLSGTMADLTSTSTRLAAARDLRQRLCVLVDHLDTEIAWYELAAGSSGVGYRVP